MVAIAKGNFYVNRMKITKGLIKHDGMSKTEEKFDLNLLD
jgi:hypothetical protein